MQEKCFLAYFNRSVFNISHTVRLAVSTCHTKRNHF